MAQPADKQCSVTLMEPLRHFRMSAQLLRLHRQSLLRTHSASDQPRRRDIPMRLLMTFAFIARRYRHRQSPLFTIPAQQTFAPGKEAETVLAVRLTLDLLC